jgi:oxalate decarboxylase/phosphoglucose isomerase-like protein (cupin superfamily)
MLQQFLAKPDAGAVWPESRIPGLRLMHVALAHQDSRRWLFVLFDGTYVARQARIAVAKEACLLGGHYHNGAELFVVLSGTAIFTVETVDPPHIREHYTLRGGDQLLVPPRVAHVAQVVDGTVLQTFTEESYVPGIYDKVYAPLHNIARSGVQNASELYTDAKRK